jgi:hypothetical protein
MKLLVIFFQSTVKSIWLTLQRTFDHTYRRIIGVPTLRYSEISPQLYLGGQYSWRGFQILKKRGITAIVSMRSRARADLPDMGPVRFLHLPTPDLSPPSLKDLEKGSRFIDDEIKRGGKVYVHCHYGEGRGPSMIAAYLITTGLTVEAALAQIRAVRGFIGLTPRQVERLDEFALQEQKKIT